jgi:hypothetical protein
MKGEARWCERSEHRERSERAEGFGGAVCGAESASGCTVSEAKPSEREFLVQVFTSGGQTSVASATPRL